MNATVLPFFLDGSRGRCFAIYHGPPADVKTRATVLCVPPFNEEMNRCRSMFTLLARSLASCGIGTLVIDLHGTGESEGHHVDARWETWKSDIKQAMDWLDRREGACHALIGVRLGVPLAADVLRQSADQSVALVAWQPVSDGKSYFTQFLRIRIAANMERTDIPKETAADMRKQLASGHPVEVAGYAVHPELAAAIEGCRLSALTPATGGGVGWFERKSGTEEGLAPASQAVVDGWRSEGRRVDVHHFEGPAFWAVHDRAVAPDLIRRTTDWLLSLRVPA